MDLDRYLAWIALMTVLQNGDYVDEMTFYATETCDPANGEPRPYFTPMAWDADDIFSECHELSINAIFDPAGLLYCTESDFDHFIFADPHIYALYVDALERAIAFATEDRFNEALERTKQMLYPLLERETVRAADVEFQQWVPGAASYEDFTAAIDAEGARLVGKLSESRRTLSDRIAMYRATHP